MYASLVACLALLLLAQSGQAAIPSGNVIKNPGAEQDTGSTDTACGGDVDSKEWDAETGAFTVVKYGTGAFPSSAEGARIGGGANFFSGGCAGPATADQTYDLSAAAAEIDAGGVSAKLSAYFGGYLGQEDSGFVRVTFLSGGGGELGSFKVGPVSAAQRDNETKFLLRDADEAVPSGTRAVRVRIGMTRTHESSNDGYVDNVSLKFSGGGGCPRARPAAPVNEVRVISLKPAAEFKRAGCGEWVELREGTTLKQGDELNVDPDGEVTLEFGDNSKVTIQETTQLKIASFFTEGGIVRTELLLKVGQVAAKVNKTETTRSDFRIKSPTHTSSVRGTAFSMFYDRGAKTSLVSVREGVVSVEGKLVRAGHEVEATPREVGPVARIGRAGAPRGGVNRVKAMEKVNRVLARGDDPCGFEVKSFRLKRIEKGWSVKATLRGRTRGKAGFKVIGKKKASATNKLGRGVARRCS